MGKVKHLDYVGNLIKFAFKANPLLYLSIAVSVFSAMIELLAMGSLLPLFKLISGEFSISNDIVSRSLKLLGFRVDAEILLWIFIILLAIRIITQLLGQSLSMCLGKRVMAQLGSRAFNKIVNKLSISNISENSIGFYIGLAGDEAFRASTLIISLTHFVSTAALAILYYAAIAVYSPIIAIFVMGFLLLSLLPLFGILKASHRLGERQTVESRKAHSIFLDSLNNLKAVRSFSAEKYIVDLYGSIIFGYSKILFLIDAFALLTKLLPILLLLLVLSVWLMLSAQTLENIGIAFIVTMIVYLMRFFPTVGQGVTLLMRIASDAKSGRDITTILEEQNTEQIKAVQFLGQIKNIKLQNICFAYDESKRNKILNEISLNFEKSISYALIGKSGVGKSTLVDLLLKFYLPTSGQLYINDEPISEVADSEIRKKIILVSQEAAIFDDTVINNVCLGQDASLVKVQAACVAASIHEFIEKMPEGYNTRLQYQGKNLSGGQRQRIAIARALLRNPDVLILDESTSALDKLTQEHVVENILQEYSNKIVIFVTHDPQVMKRVDKVIDLGEINFINNKSSFADSVIG